MSKADILFIEMCKDIIENGTSSEGQKVRPVWEDGTSAHTIKKFGVVNKYDLREEFPALTLRPTAIKSAFDELLWIWQKKSNITEELNSKIWDSWTTIVINNKELINIEDKLAEISKILDENGEGFFLGNDIYADVHNVGYYGDAEDTKYKEYFGDYYDKWKTIWEEMCKTCSTADIFQHRPKYTMSNEFKICHNFFDWVMKTNEYGMEGLKHFNLDIEYYGTKHYSKDTCTLLLKEEINALKELKWYCYKNHYFFDRLSLAEFIKEVDELDFIHQHYEINLDPKLCTKKEVSSEFMGHLYKLKQNGELKEFVTQSSKYRFSLNRFHSIKKAYGYQLNKKYKFPGGYMDQVDNILWQLKNTPFSRRMLTNIFNFQDLTEMGLEPCAYSMTFNVTLDKEGRMVLNGILNQRSQDILAANNWNVVQYALLLMMFAQVSGMIPGEFVHVISDAHIYDRHVPIIKEMLERPQYPAPKVSLNKDITDFYKFTVSDLIIEDYQKNPQIKNIPIAI